MSALTVINDDTIGEKMRAMKGGILEREQSILRQRSQMPGLLNWLVRIF